MNTLINSKGITILELMVTLAIVAILASAAIPSYQNYSMRSNRSDGIESIHAILSAQERYYADNMTYADSLTKLGMGSTSYTTPKGYYKITVESMTAEIEAVREAIEEYDIIRFGSVGVDGRFPTLSRTVYELLFKSFQQKLRN